MAKLHTSGDRSRLPDSNTTSKYWYPLNATVGSNVPPHLQVDMSVSLGTLQHQDADPIKMHPRSSGRTSFNVSGLWIGAVTGL